MHLQSFCRRTLAVACCLAVLPAVWARGDDPPQAQQTQTEQQQIRIALPALDGQAQVRILQQAHEHLEHADVSPYWIGLIVEPVGDALKSHLKLGYGLVVQNVIDDSPAQAAGLQQHDIVTELNGAQLKDVQDLLKAVGEAKEQECKLEVIRGGEKQTVELTPAKRPEGDATALRIAPRIENGEIRVWVEKMLKDAGEPGARRLLIVGPGVTSHKTLKESFSLNVERKDGQPTKITVKRGDKTWIVGEDNIDSLPNELQVIVRGALRPPLPPIQPGAIKWAPRQIHNEIQERIIKHVAPESTKLQTKLQTKQLHDILQELKQLRQEVDELKKAHDN